MIICNNKQIKGLFTLKSFVEKNPTIENKDNILDIIENSLVEGCYTKKTRKKLNDIRDLWFNETHAGEYICRYCLKDTSQVEYDYMNGTDHLECSLKSELE